MAALARHLAVIPDGNRRWARARGLPAEAGHQRGITSFSSLIPRAFEHSVETFTFWWGSPANLQLRSSGEVAAIVASLSGWLERDCPDLLRSLDCRIEMLGRWRELCPELAAPLATAQAAASKDAKRRIVVLMAYDGRDELRAAVDAATQAGSSASFPERLWTAHLPPVDLLVRTGDSAHLSAGFMLWSIAEARLAFPSSMWPDLTADELSRLLTQADSQERRYGA
jgi:undecaprenyl diphosphate synthase